MASKSTILFICALIYLLCYVGAVPAGELKSFAVKARNVERFNPQPDPPHERVKRFNPQPDPPHERVKRFNPQPDPPLN
ncbi:2180_t:CDS:2 [Paraglomus occultum]|uniref:2180_t:CDS:1 n=1 Tax=Paraglomus occultum TaxID=144539 RepID=A0A9N9ATN8_9GLOM|nr:2180_t:CDS:2 [Paraglomus occultum]